MYVIAFKIPYEPLANLFAKASDFKGTRFFWQTPDKNVGFLGFGRNLLRSVETGPPKT